jgi:hypothetical protein
MMNERLKQLAIESKLIAPEYNGFDHTRLSISQQKFAELIVRECMDIAKKWEDQLENADSLSESNAVGIVAYRIARQFGVKQ